MARLPRRGRPQAPPPPPSPAPSARRPRLAEPVATWTAPPRRMGKSRAERPLARPPAPFPGARRAPRPSSGARRSPRGRLGGAPGRRCPTARRRVRGPRVTLRHARGGSPRPPGGRRPGRAPWRTAPARRRSSGARPRRRPATSRSEPGDTARPRTARTRGRDGRRRPPASGPGPPPTRSPRSPARLRRASAVAGRADPRPGRARRPASPRVRDSDSARLLLLGEPFGRGEHDVEPEEDEIDAGNADRRLAREHDAAVQESIREVKERELLVRQRRERPGHGATLAKRYAGHGPVSSTA